MIKNGSHGKRARKSVIGLHRIYIYYVFLGRKVAVGWRTNAVIKSYYIQQFKFALVWQLESLQSFLEMKGDICRLSAKNKPHKNWSVEWMHSAIFGSY